MTAPQAYRGEQLGLPRQRPGSLAPAGPRLLAFMVDALASALVAALFVHHPAHGGSSVSDRLPGAWSLIPFALDYIVGLLVAPTAGMYLVGLRVIRTDAAVAVDPGRAIVRTGLLVLLVPAIVFDRDGRGLHDRLTDTAVVRH